MTDVSSSEGPRLTRLPEGLYELLETQDVQRRVEAAVDISPMFADVPDDSLGHHLGTHLSGLIRHALRAAPTREAQRELAERVVSALGVDYLPDRPVVGGAGTKLRMLREVRSADARDVRPLARPNTPLSDVALLTNANGEPSIGAEIREELASADRVDLLCAFVKWHGLRTLERELAALKERSVPFRVITTTYIGATERAALDRIVQDFGGDVRVNYTTTSTRLHAKAWFFFRESGWSTAYVGSSNLSKAAMLDGLEWNVRLSSIATPSLMKKFQATFDTYWADPAFEAYHPAQDAARLDAELRKGGASDSGLRVELAGLDVTPYPHQARMLDDLNGERAKGFHRNLLVAATGTGKTVMAALDYRDLARAAGSLPSLLFVAHRKEILEQALRTYRAVLNDGAFGELYVDGARPQRWEHVFASVQSLNSRGIRSFAEDHFEVVVIDEFHHASAATYRHLLDYLKPAELLGLTATPERADGVNVKDLFGGRIASEMRLWDALEADILVPFHYFAIHDDVDLAHVTWKNGGYDRAELDALYTGDDARARKIIKAVKDKCGEGAPIKALGFCAGVAHARFMAQAFEKAGIPARVVVGETGSAERAEAFAALRSGDVSVLFGVDVFNEGVDIPDVDTVLFLRPTQSATVFLQQLGRGLRRSHGKDVLTALDFVGHQRQEFRFDLKLRALTGAGRKQLENDVEAGFPYLPPGSQIVLDEVAQQKILTNIRQQVGLNKNQLAQDVRQHADSAGVSLETYTVQQYLDDSGRELADVYRPGINGRSWTTLRDLARGQEVRNVRADEDRRMTLRAVGLRHVDDVERAQAYVRLLRDEVAYEDLPAQDQQFARMLYFTLLHDQRSGGFSSFGDALAWARGLPLFVDEVSGLLEYTLAQARTVPEEMDLGVPTVLRSHAHYRREEILAGLDYSSWDKTQSSHREGVLYAPHYNTDAFLVTLQKDERQFTPSTMYRDYAVSRNLFHWESQSVTTAASPTGQRYIAKEHGASHTVMFVRKSGSDAVGQGAAFLNMGTVQFKEWTRTERPMQITWGLDRAMPASAYQAAKAVS